VGVCELRSHRERASASKPNRVGCLNERIIMDEESNMVKVVELLMEIEESSEENDGGGEYFIAEDGTKIIY
jgi:hypothetical protein